MYVIISYIILSCRVLTFSLVSRHRCLGTLWRTDCCRFSTGLSVRKRKRGVSVTYTQYNIIIKYTYKHGIVYNMYILYMIRIYVENTCNVCIHVGFITFSFWYAVTAMNSVSLNTYVRKVEYGNLMMSLALTRWKRGWYLCIEFKMV